MIQIKSKITLRRKDLLLPRIEKKNMHSADVSWVTLTLVLNRYPSIWHLQGRYVTGRCGGEAYEHHHPLLSKQMLSANLSPQVT